MFPFFSHVRFESNLFICPLLCNASTLQAFKSKYQHPAPRAYWKHSASSAYAPFDPRVPAAAISLEPIPPEYFEVHAALAKPIPAFARSASASVESRNSFRGSATTSTSATSAAADAAGGAGLKTPGVLVRAHSAAQPVAPRPFSVADLPFQLLMCEDAQRIFEVFLAENSPLQVGFLHLFLTLLAYSLSKTIGIRSIFQPRIVEFCESM
jgi:hypothetical protein